MSAHRPRDNDRWRRTLLRVAGAIIAAVCAVVLVMRATDGVRVTDSLSSDASVSRAAAQNAFYDCISNEARKLVTSGESLWIATDPGTSVGLELLSAVIPWAHVAADAKQANVVLSLATADGQPACSGMVVLAVLGGLK